MQCANHPDVETGLTCNKCGKPICPACMVQTPVGARCVQCAKLKKLPTFQLSPAVLARSILAGLGTALVSGIIWYLISHFIFYIPFLNILLAAAVGYGIGQVISLSVNRKRGLPLKVIASISVFIAYLIGNHIGIPFHIILYFNLLNIVAIAVGVYLAIFRL
jgi:hypothetical protein